MAKQPESVRIEVKTKDQAQMLNYALGVVHQTLSSNMEQVAACFKKEATILVGYKGIYRQL